MSALRICLWSGPRNVSTALMYSFAQRRDTRVIDEPLYGHYLRVSRVSHPGRDEVLATMDSDGPRVVREVILGPCDRPILFMKQMAHHLMGDLDRGFLRRTVNVILTRDPIEMLPSLAKNIPRPTLADTGLAMQAALLAELNAFGHRVPVLDARELLLDPGGVLRQLCSQIGIPFDPAMLHWPAGPRPEDGCWAKDWYGAVHRSTGFAPYRAPTEPPSDALKPLWEECVPYYERLRGVALRAGASSGPAAPRAERLVAGSVCD